MPTLPDELRLSSTAETLGRRAILLSKFSRLEMFQCVQKAESWTFAKLVPQKLEPTEQKSERKAIPFLLILKSAEEPKYMPCKSWKALQKLGYKADSRVDFFFLACVTDAYLVN